MKTVKEPKVICNCWPYVWNAKREETNACDGNEYAPNFYDKNELKLLERKWHAMNKILLVDDDSNIRKLVAILLQNEGYEVVQCEDGRDALSKLGEHKIDLAIIDIMMPNMDGWDLCKQMRKYYEFPILMLSAQGEVTHKVKGFELGTDDYMTKPFEPA